MLRAYMLVRTVPSCFIAMLVLFGCTRKTPNFDGIYEAFPFDYMGLSSTNYLIIRDNVVTFYSPRRTLTDAGYIVGDRWTVWGDPEIVLKRTADGVTMQVVGKDSFVELPEATLDKETCESIPEVMKVPVSDFLEKVGEPQILNGSAYQRWKNFRMWNEKYKYRPSRMAMDLCFSSSVSVSNNYAVVELTYTATEPHGFVFNPSEFHGHIVVLWNDKYCEVIDCLPVEQPSLVMVQPNQVFTYRIDLSTAEQSSSSSSITNRIVFSELIIDVPNYKVRSATDQ